MRQGAQITDRGWYLGEILDTPLAVPSALGRRDSLLVFNDADKYKIVKMNTSQLEKVKT